MPWRGGAMASWSRFWRRGQAMSRGRRLHCPTPWPRTGVPERPEAWLVTVARRKLIDQARRRRTRRDAAGDLGLIGEELQAVATEENAIPDERLRLMFACAHPAIDAAIRAPLILQ